MSETKTESSEGISALTIINELEKDEKYGRSNRTRDRGDRGRGARNRDRGNRDHGSIFKGITNELRGNVYEVHSEQRERG